MERKICTHCNIEKNIEDFYNKYTECKICTCNRSLQRYYQKKDKLSNQEKYIMKKTEKYYYKNKTTDI